MSFPDRRTVNILLTILLFSVVLALTYVARAVIVIFCFGILFAYLIDPVVRFLQRHSLLFKNLRGPHVAEAYLGLLILIACSFISCSRVAGANRQSSAAASSSERSALERRDRYRCGEPVRMERFSGAATENISCSPSYSHSEHDHCHRATSDCGVWLRGDLHNGHDLIHITLPPQVAACLACSAWQLGLVPSLLVHLDNHTNPGKLERRRLFCQLGSTRQTVSEFQID